MMQPLNFQQSMSHLSFSRAQETCNCLPYISAKQTLSPEADEQMSLLISNPCDLWNPSWQISLCSSRERHSPWLSWAVQNMPAKREGFLLPFFLEVMQRPEAFMVTVSQWSFPPYLPPEISLPATCLVICKMSKKGCLCLIHYLKYLPQQYNK